MKKISGISALLFFIAFPAFAANYLLNGGQESQINYKMVQYVLTSPGYDSTYSFKTGKGNCQNYSHPSVALMRSVGIPARIVHGVTLKEPYDITMGNSFVTMKLEAGRYWGALGFTGRPIVKWFYTYGKPVGPIDCTRYRTMFHETWCRSLSFGFNYRVTGLAAKLVPINK